MQPSSYENETPLLTITQKAMEGSMCVLLFTKKKSRICHESLIVQGSPLNVYMYT